MDFSVKVDIAAPPERVWAVMIDIERWSEWTPSITGIERLDAGPVQPGSRARVSQPKLLPAVWTVTTLEPGRGFAWMTGRPGLRVLGTHSVEPIADGSRVTLALRFAGVLGRLVARLTRGLSNRYLNLEAAGLKRRCEGR